MDKYMLLQEILSSDDDDDEALLQLLDNGNASISNLLPLLQRVEHRRVPNYLETIHNYDDIDFIRHFRLSRPQVCNLIEMFSHSSIFLYLNGHGGRKPVTPENAIYAYLWFAGNEAEGYRKVADRFDITLNTLFNVITRVSDFIISELRHIIRFPSEEEKQRTAQYFFQATGIPGAIGAIDGSHIRIDRPSPQNDPVSYVNRKKYYSMHVQAVVDHRARFLDVFIGYPGCVHDARVYQESDIFTLIPELCGTEYRLLGDSAYPLSAHMLVPYKDNGHLSQAQKNFNRKLSTCRVVVEHTFGLLKQRFRQLYHLKFRNLARMVKFIHACCILHNLGDETDFTVFGPPIPDDNPDTGTQATELDGNNLVFDNQMIENLPDGKIIRDQICNSIIGR